MTDGHCIASATCSEKLGISKTRLGWPTGMSKTLKDKYPWPRISSNTLISQYVQFVGSSDVLLLDYLGLHLPLSFAAHFLGHGPTKSRPESGHSPNAARSRTTKAVTRLRKTRRHPVIERRRREWRRRGESAVCATIEAPKSPSGWGCARNQSIKVPYPSYERGRLYKRIFDMPTCLVLSGLSPVLSCLTIL